MMKSRRLTSIIFIISLTISCNNNDSKGDTNEGDVFVFAESELNYTAVNNRIIAPYCLSCHAAATGNQGGINLETLASLSSRISTLNRVAVVDKSMPKPGSSPLPQGAINMLDAWLRAGAPE